MEENLVIEVRYIDNSIVTIKVSSINYSSIKNMYKAINNFIRTLISNKTGDYLINLHDYFNIDNGAVMSFISTYALRSIYVYPEDIYKKLCKLTKEETIQVPEEKPTTKSRSKKKDEK